MYYVSSASRQSGPPCLRSPAPSYRRHASAKKTNNKHTCPSAFSNAAPADELEPLSKLSRDYEQNVSVLSGEAKCTWTALAEWSSSPRSMRLSDFSSCTTFVSTAEHKSKLTESAADECEPRGCYKQSSGYFLTSARTVPGV